MNAVRKTSTFFWILSALTTLSGCNKLLDKSTIVEIAPQKGEPIAQVGHVTLTLENLSEQFLARQGRFRGSPQMNTPEKREEFVESQVTQEVLFQEALAQGYFNNPMVLMNVKKFVTQQYVNEKLKDEITNAKFGDEEMKTHYDQNQNFYNREEAMRGNYIYVPFGSDKKQSLKKATEAQSEVVKNVKFGNTRVFNAYYKKYSSKNPSANTPDEQATGDLGYFTKAMADEKLGEKVWEQLVPMKETGAISSVLEAKDGYYVFMKTGYRKALAQTFEEAKPEIQKRLAHQNQGKLYEGMVKNLKEKYKVKIIKEKIADLGKEAHDPTIKAKENVAEKEPEPKEPQPE